MYRRKIHESVLWFEIKNLNSKSTFLTQYIHILIDRANAERHTNLDKRGFVLKEKEHASTNLRKYINHWFTSAKLNGRYKQGLIRRLAMKFWFIVVRHYTDRCSNMLQSNKISKKTSTILSHHCSKAEINIDRSISRSTRHYNWGMMKSLIWNLGLDRASCFWIQWTNFEATIFLMSRGF